MRYNDLIKNKALANLAKINDDYFAGFYKVYSIAKEFWQRTKTGVEKSTREYDNAKATKYANCLASPTYLGIIKECRAASMVSMEIIEMICSGEIMENIEKRKKAAGDD